MLRLITIVCMSQITPRLLIMGARPNHDPRAGHDHDRVSLIVVMLITLTAHFGTTWRARVDRSLPCDMSPRGSKRKTVEAAAPMVQRGLNFPRAAQRNAANSTTNQVHM